MKTVLFTTCLDTRSARLRKLGAVILFLFVTSWLSSINMTVQLPKTDANQSSMSGSVSMSTSMMSEHCHHKKCHHKQCDHCASSADCSATHCSIIGVLPSSGDATFGLLGYDDFEYLNPYDYQASSPPYIPPITQYV